MVIFLKNLGLWIGQYSPPPLKFESSYIQISEAQIWLYAVINVTLFSILYHFNFVAFIFSNRNYKLIYYL